MGEHRTRQHEVKPVDMDGLAASLPLMRQRAETAFERAFGMLPQACVQAPGRVNLIGEHTDYNDGFVLPCAIDRATVIALRPRADQQVRVLALDCNSAHDQFALDQPITRQDAQPWSHHVRGMVQQLVASGHRLPGVDMVVTGNVPQGAGLSSSAALEVAVGTAFLAAGALPALDPKTLARMAQLAENSFVGCQCGIMDPLVSACGQAGHALLLDCRSLATRSVALPAGVAVLIVHSMVRRGLVDSQYNARRLACEAAARHFAVPALRDLSLSQLSASHLDVTVFKRARHVLTENARTLLAAQALADGDLAQMGRLMAASHVSMRDDFEITVPAVDRLVQIVGDAIAGNGGCRMTGGGFGGCIVALLPQAQVATVVAAVDRHYRSPEGLAATVFVCQASAGAGLMSE